MDQRTPQQWVYTALVGLTLLLAGWLWQIVSVLREDVHHMQDTKADKSQVNDRWTFSQQEEYRLYVDSRITELHRRVYECEKDNPKVKF